MNSNAPSPPADSRPGRPVTPANLIRRATRATSWPEVVRLIETQWPYLLFEHPASLAYALRSAPISALGGSAVSLALRDILAVEPVSQMHLPRLLDLRGQQAVGGSEQARRALELNLGAMVALRRRGQFEQAQAYSRQLDTMRRSAERHHALGTAGLAALVLGQSAILSELLGDPTSATAQLREAYRAAPSSEFDFSLSAAAARLSFSFARRGQLGLAEAWLTTTRESNGPRGLAGRTVHRLVRLIETVIATAQLHRALATQAMDALDDVRPGDEEYWPFVVEARVRFVVTWGDAASIEACLREVRHRGLGVTRTHANAGVVAPILIAAETNLLIGLGRGDEARTALDRGPDRHPLLDEPRARLALLAADSQRALDLARAALDRPMLSAITRLEMNLVTAVAASRLGQVGVAADALRRAVHQSNLLGLLQPFAAVPYADLLTVAERVPEAEVLLRDERLVAASRHDAQPVSVISLTAREQILLERLASGLTASQIAISQQLSINTIRTQRHRLYQKLGAASLAEARQVAADLGLIREPHGQ